MTQKTVTIVNTITSHGEGKYSGRRTEDTEMNVHERIVCLEREMTVLFLMLIRDAFDTDKPLEGAVVEGKRLLGNMILSSAELARETYTASDTKTIWDGRDLLAADATTR